jgi:hypothetical protein
LDSIPSQWRDAVGARGEAVFKALITREHPSRGFLVSVPLHLGEKREALDFFVELYTEGAAPAYCFVQVKTTRRGYTRNGRLRVGVSARQMSRLAAYPGPTYVVGVDETAAIGYAVYVGGEAQVGASSLCTDVPLDVQGLERLWDDVREFWLRHPKSRFNSALADPTWSDR